MSVPNPPPSESPLSLPRVGKLRECRTPAATGRARASVTACPGAGSESRAFVSSGCVMRAHRGAASMGGAPAGPVGASDCGALWLCACIAGALHEIQVEPASQGGLLGGRGGGASAWKPCRLSWLNSTPNAPPPSQHPLRSRASLLHPEAQAATEARRFPRPSRAGPRAGRARGTGAELRGDTQPQSSVERLQHAKHLPGTGTALPPTSIY